MRHLPSLWLQRVQLMTGYTLASPLSTMSEIEEDVSGSTCASRTGVLRLRVSAKINLHLQVLARRPDNYHEIESLLQSVSLYDYLQFRTAARLTVECAHPRVPQGKYNLAYRAAQLFFARTGISRRAAIHIDKHIPVGAGLGGGSADAAGTLVGLNQLFAAGVPVSILSN